MEARLNMDRECESCQKPFKAIKPNQKFCSQRCARKVRFARYVERKASGPAEDSQGPVCVASRLRDAVEIECTLPADPRLIWEP